MPLSELERMLSAGLGFGQILPRLGLSGVPLEAALEAVETACRVSGRSDLFEALWGRVAAVKGWSHDRG